MKKIPKHVGIIMDGNGRWADERSLERIEGHKEGSKRILEIIDQTYKIEIPYLTFFALSSENFTRPQEELDNLSTVVLSFLKELKNHLKKHEGKINIQGLGSKQIHPIPGKFEENSYKFKKVIEYQEKISSILKTFKKSDNSQLTVNFAANYGSRLEIIDAIKEYLSAIKKQKETIETLNWERFSKYLYTKRMPDPDLIIRTSGEQRLSNFLALQSTYSELYFTPVLWPDFTKDDFLKAVRHFQKKERRFGSL